jgi:imidazolonepropionase
LKYTIKDGIIYDTEELLADVRELVKASFEADIPEKFVPRVAAE